MKKRWQKHYLLSIIISLILGSALAQDQVHKITHASVSQSKDELPKITPSRAIHFDGEGLLGDYCVDDFFIDEAGRMFLSTCGVMKRPFFVDLFQYDGYTIWPYELGLKDLDRIVGVQIQGYDKILGFYGFVNHRSGTSNLFRFQPELDSLILLPETETYVGNIIAIAPGQLLVIKKVQDSVTLYNWDDQKLEQIDQLFYPLVKNLEGTITRNVTDKPFKKMGQYIYYRDHCLPLLRYDLKTQSIKTWDVSSFLDQKAHLPCKGWGTEREHSLEIIDNSIFYLSNTQSPRFYTLKAGASYFEALPISSKEGIARAIFKDEIGNLLFFYRTQKDEQEVVLLDNLGQYWDYSPMLAGFAKIYNIVGKNFKKQAFVATSKGAYLVSSNNQSAISTYFKGKSLRWVVEATPNQYFVREDGIGKMYLLNTAADSTNTIVPDIFADQFIAIPRKMLKAPDGRVFFKADSSRISGFQIYDPLQPDSISSFQHLDMRSTWLSTIMPNGAIAFIANIKQQLHWYHPEQNKVEVALYNGKPIQLSKANSHYLLAGRDGHLWVASNNGIYKVHPQKNKLDYFDFPSSEVDYRMVVLHEDRQGRILVGTVKNGIQLIDPETGEILQVINAEKGLSNNTVVNILEDDEGDFWVGTFNGLNIISPDGNVRHKLYEEDGLPANEFNRFCFTKASNGHLLMGTINGLIDIDPIALKQTLYKRDKTHIYISELTYYDQRQQKEITFRNFNPSNKTITLPARQRYLNVKMALSNYGFSEQSNFVYKLEGINKDWNYLGKQHDISLSNLPPGRYRLVINGIDEQGNWTETPIILKLHIKDFFYRQSWFFLLCLVVTGTIGYIWIVSLRREKKRLEKEVEYRTRQIVHDKELIEEQAAELKQIDEIKSRFFTNISHELRTPVTLIATPVEHILRKHTQSLSRELKKSLQIVWNNSKRLKNLVEELLELSRLEAGKAQLSQTSTHLHSFCRQLFSAYESGAQLKQISYQFQFELEKSLYVMVDKKRLEKIINNLLSNALKFTPKGGSVKLMIKEESSTMLIQVTDSGRGIPQEDLPFIFDRYFQTRKKNIPTEGGTGIGLALSKELAELMQGSLSVKSDWGKGSVFTLRLPLQKVAAPKIIVPPTVLESTPKMVQEQPLPFQHSKTAQQEKILIVEDNPDMQQLLFDLLSEQYHCLMANNGAEAWILLKNEDLSIQNIQLILSDIMMPQMDGYTLLNKIKEHPRWQKLPVIMLTARAAEMDKLQALRMGVDDYLIKPFSPEELLTRINNLIYNYHQRQAFITTDNTPVSIIFENKPSIDQTLLQSLEDAIMDAIDKKLEISTLQLADQLAISDRNLRRRIKSLTGLSTKQYIQEIKLQKARHLLENKTYNTISEVAYNCGFNTPAYFTKIFEHRFGKRPGEYFSESPSDS